MKLNLADNSAFCTLITGASGLLGSYAGQYVGGQTSVHGLSTGGENAYFLNSHKLDLTKKQETWDFLNTVRPNTIIHMAGLTDVNRCEENPQEAIQMNVETTRNLIDWICDRLPYTRFVYISTDHVYSSSGPHTVNAINPVNVYAMTKLAAEQETSRCENHVVLRVNFLGLSPRKHSFLGWLLYSLDNGQEITLFEDVIINPLPASTTVKEIFAFARSTVTGTFNLGASGSPMSKADIGLKLCELTERDSRLITFGQSTDINTNIRRPKDMSMDVRATEVALGRPLQQLNKGLNQTAQEIKNMDRQT